jgi:superfamily II DNA/RNA helicase
VNQFSTTSTPNEFESKIIPILTDEKSHIIVESQFSYGKTQCFVISMLTMVDPSKKFPQVLFVAPSFELAEEVFKLTKKFSLKTDITVDKIVKGSKWDDAITSQSIYLFTLMST